MTARPEARWALRARWCAALALLLACGAQALAQRPAGRVDGPQWRQRVQRWERLAPRQRQNILREQQRYRSLPPQEQRRLFEQYRRQRRR